MEFDDTERQGGFEPLRYLPNGKNIVLGLVSTKRPELESIDSLQSSVSQAAEIIAKARGINQEQAKGCISISPQCGFSSSSLGGGKDVDIPRMWEKLTLVRDAARKIWDDAQ